MKASLRSTLFLCVAISACAETNPVTPDASTDRRDADVETLDAATTADASPLVDAAIDAAHADADAAMAPRGTVEVLAGQTATGFADGIGDAARFSGPAGAALAPDGSALYVSDTFNALIRRIDTTTGAVTTVAGRLQVQATGDGVGVAATFQSPRAMAVTPDGTALYVADGPTIRRVEIGTWEVTTVAGAAGMPGNVDAIGDAARLGFLQHSYAFAPDGARLYISDRSSKTLRAFDPTTGMVETVAGATYPGFAAQHADGVGADVRFAGIGGLAWAGGALFVVDTFNSCVRRFDPSTREVTTFAGDPTMQGNMDGVGSAATFETPQSIAADATHLWITGFNGLIRRVRLSDASVDRVLGSDTEVFARDGDAETARFGVAFGPPVIDAATGVLFFQDRDASSTRAIDLTTLATTTLAGAVEPTGSRDGALLDARFGGPARIVCEATRARCYVSDSGNHTIRILDREAGTVATLAGTAGEPGADDGVGAAARFAGPSGLALDESAGTLFVADTANHTLRAIRLSDASVSTLAGSAEIDGSVDGVGEVARFASPAALALDGGRLFVADTDNVTVRAVELSTGAVTTLVGTAGVVGYVDAAGPAAQLRSVSGLVTSADGASLYVADRSSSTLRVVDLATAEMSTLAGADRTTGVVDGALGEALFDGPGDLLRAGNVLYVADVRNHTVRAIDLAAGTVSTWLGNVVVSGNPAPGAIVPWADATFFFPSALARLDDDLLVLAEDAVIVARPESAW